MDQATAKKVVNKFVIPLEEAELAVRMLEAAGQLKRPAGWSAAQAFDNLDAVDRDAWRRAAHAAMDYWRECINAAQKPS